MIIIVAVIVLVIIKIISIVIAKMSRMVMIIVIIVRIIIIMLIIIVIMNYSLPRLTVIIRSFFVFTSRENVKLPKLVLQLIINYWQCIITYVVASE